MTFTPDAVLADEERRAGAVYDRLVQPVVRPDDQDKFVAIAFEVDDFEIDADELASANRLLARRPGARLWLMRTNRNAAYSVGKVPRPR